MVKYQSVVWSWRTLFTNCWFYIQSHYPVEIDPPGIPPHNLQLKVGTPVVLPRNLTPMKLCNGTWLQAKFLHREVIEAIIFTDCGVGETIFLPLIPLVPSDNSFSLSFCSYLSRCFNQRKASLWKWLKWISGVTVYPCICCLFTCKLFRYSRVILQKGGVQNIVYYYIGFIKSLCLFSSKSLLKIPRSCRYY